MPFADRIDALLDTLASGTAEEVETALDTYSMRDIVGVLAQRLLDAEAGSGGSIPDPTGHADGEVLTLASETPGWIAPAAGGLPMVIVHDSTGYTFPGAAGNSRDPMPRTAYTVDRDDLGAVTDPTDGVYLPAGIYLGGGYVDWVPDAGFPTPSGAIVAFVEAASNGMPEGDLGAPNLAVDMTDMSGINLIEAETRAFRVAANTFFRMKVRFDSTDSFTVVRWVFWAARMVDLT